MTTSDPRPNTSVILAIILVSYTMIVLDVSVVITALPEIERTLGFTATGLSWVHNAYTLAFGGLLLLGARMGDVLGRRRMLVAGLALFTLASVLVGAAQSAMMLLAARALQGAGAAVLAPSTLALLQVSFAEGPARTRAVAYYAAAAGVAASLGLVLGGVLTSLVSWRMGFLINLPIGLARLFATRRRVAETPRRSGAFDVAGAFTSTLGMVALVYGIVRSAEAGWGDAITLVSIASGVLLLALFVAVERRAVQPILPLRLFASRDRSAAYLARVLFLAAMAPFWFFTTQFLQGVLGWSPIAAGLAFLPATIPSFVAAAMSPRLAGRFGRASLLASSLATGVVGLAWLGQVTADSAYLTGVALPMMLVGLAQGGALGPLTVAAVTGVDHRDAGAASGILNAAHQLGGSLGLGALVAVFASADVTGLAPGALLAHRLAVALTGGAAIAALAFLVVAAMIVRPTVTVRADAPCASRA